MSILSWKNTTLVFSTQTFGLGIAQKNYEKKNMWICVIKVSYVDGSLLFKCPTLLIRNIKVSVSISNEENHENHRARDYKGRVWTLDGRWYRPLKVESLCK